MINLKENFKKINIDINNLILDNIEIWTDKDYEDLKICRDLLFKIYKNT